jgi:glycerol-1-phosphate dehydrogenase [NAD(P)+]
MPTRPIYGNWNSVDFLDKIDKYILCTMEEPWEIIKPKLSSIPIKTIFNKFMDIDHLKSTYNNLEATLEDSITIVGLGGGTACDTAKYLTWKAKKQAHIDIDLILIPSIISVDAFLCSSIAVRDNNKVNYIGESHSEKILIDHELIKSAPKFLNRAGVSDTISITSALGDWVIGHENNNEQFDKMVFNEAKKIATDLMVARNEIRDISEKGIEALVKGFFREVDLCEKWGNARPEEGSEHFLAYCLESITHDHYIHGQLIGMNILISLYLQDEMAVFSIDEIRQFFSDIKLDISPQSNNIPIEVLREAFNRIQKYVKNENLMYSIYNSPNLILDDRKIDEIIQFIKTI